MPSTTQPCDEAPARRISSKALLLLLLLLFPTFSLGLGHPTRPTCMQGAAKPLQLAPERWVLVFAHQVRLRYQPWGLVWDSPDPFSTAEPSLTPQLLGA